MAKGIYCRKCGTKMPQDSCFCPKCGTKIYSFYDDIEDYNIEEYEEYEEYNNEYVEHKVKTKIKSRLSINLKKLIFDVIILSISLILFILSFFNIYTIKSEIDDSTTIKCSFSAVDFISIMGGTINKFKDIDDYVDSKLYEDLQEAYEDFEESLDEDYNSRTGKYSISKETKTYLHKILVLSAKSVISYKDYQGGADEKNVIFMGISCLFGIIFSFAILILSIIMLVFDILKKENKLKKWIIALIPAYFVLSLLIIFLGGTIINLSDDLIKIGLAGSMIISIIFESIAIVGLIINAFFEKKCSMKNLILHSASIVLIIITLACAFAPFVTLEAKVVPTDLSKKTYKYEFEAQIIENVDLNNYIEKEFKEENRSGKEIFSNYLDNIFDDGSHSNKYYKGDSAKIDAENLIVNAAVARDKYKIVEKLSNGYYLLILIFLIFGVIIASDFASMYGVETKKVLISLKAIVYTLLILVVVCTVIFIILAQNGLEYVYIKNVNVKIGGGSIVMLMFACIGFIIEAIRRKSTY